MSALVISYICFSNKPHNLRNLLLLQADDAFRMKQPSLTILILRPTFNSQRVCHTVFKSQLAECDTILPRHLYCLTTSDVQLCSFSRNTALMTTGPSERVYLRAIT